MASVIEDDDDLTGNREQVGTTPAADLSTKDTPTAPEAPPKEDKLGKFKGKTPEEIAAAYAELEQRFGAQGAEIGELRKFTDGLIRSDLERRQAKQEAPSKTEPQATEDDDALFFTNPREAIKRELERNDLIKDLAKSRTETQQEKAKRLTFEKHPDADAIVNDPEFQSWVKGSKVRSNLFVAACNFDSDAAIELFDTFKALNPTKAAAKGDPAPEKVDPVAADAAVAAQRKAADAAVGTAGSSNAETGSKPIYSRRKIMELMMKNPAEYEARSDEFLAAYAEGRVRK